MRKALLLCREKPSVKKKNASMFDVTMGSYVGLYRDDRLALLKNTTARAGDKTKNLINFFGEFGLKVTAETSQKITIFLHITQILSTKKFHPCRCTSKHPPSILRQIPPSINKKSRNSPQTKNPSWTQ